MCVDLKNDVHTKGGVTFITAFQIAARARVCDPVVVANHFGVAYQFGGVVAVAASCLLNFIVS